jgi:hypothetical protein
MNQAIRTRVSQHKPPRLYLNHAAGSEVYQVNPAISMQDNHTYAVQGFVDKLLAKTDYIEIVSAFTAVDETEAVHIIKTVDTPVLTPLEKRKRDMAILEMTKQDISAIQAPTKKAAASIEPLVEIPVHDDNNNNTEVIPF